MMRMPGLALAIMAASMRPTVSAFLGRWIEMKSEQPITSSRLMSSTPMCRARSSETKGS